MIKLVLGAFFVALTTLVGVKLSERKKFVCEFFERLKTFNDRLSLDVSLYSRSLYVALSSLDKETDGVLSGCEVIFEGKDFVCVDKRLSQKQRDFVSFYVNSLGTYDAAGEKDRLFAVKERLDEFYTDSRARSEKFSALSVKLAFSLGLTVLIIMI